MGRMARPKKRFRIPAWLTLGKGGSGQSLEVQADGFPREVYCGCCSFILLSQEHLALILGMLVGLIVFILEIFMNDGGSISFIVLLFTFLVESSILLLLARFEEVDAIQTLEREVRQLKDQTDKVQQQSEQMKKFWEEVQHITDIWLFRTVPRLDLHKAKIAELSNQIGED